MMIKHDGQQIEVKRALTLMNHKQKSNESKGSPVAGAGIYSTQKDKAD